MIKPLRSQSEKIKYRPNTAIYVLVVDWVTRTQKHVQKMYYHFSKNKKPIYHYYQMLITDAQIQAFLVHLQLHRK